MDVVTFAHVSKRFGTVQALDDISMAVPPGKVTAFLGPNGAGKTTAISLMLGLRNPTDGEVRVLGMNPHDLRARARMGVMLQESGVPGTLRVRELIDLFRSYYPHPLPTQMAIEKAALDEKADALVSTLSGGQRQRLYFALAICGDPEIIFLDEPTVALDVEARHHFWAQVRAFVDAGKTVVLTTHYIEEADALADRVIVIDRGRIIAEGTPAAIKARVAGKRVRFETAPSLTEADLAGLPMQHLELTPGHVTVFTSEPEACLRLLFARGLEVRDLEVVGAALEDAFLALTAKRGREGS